MQQRSAIFGLLETSTEERGWWEVDIVEDGHGIIEHGTTAQGKTDIRDAGTHGVLVGCLNKEGMEAVIFTIDDEAGYDDSPARKAHDG